MSCFQSNQPDSLSEAESYKFRECEGWACASYTAIS